MIIDTATLTRAERNELINGLVYPRPIAWVSTQSAAGVRNLAPFSFFNAFSFDPPTLAIGPGSRAGVQKDTLRNIIDTGEMVIHLVTEQLMKTANLTSTEWGPEVDEWAAVGLQALPSARVAPERVASAPVAFECSLRQIVELGSIHRPSNSLVIASVLCIHVDDEAMDGLRPRPEILRLVGRMGGPLWVRTHDHVELARPPAVSQTTP